MYDSYNQQTNQRFFFSSYGSILGGPGMVLHDIPVNQLPWEIHHLVTDDVLSELHLHFVWGFLIAKFEYQKVTPIVR